MMLCYISIIDYDLPKIFLILIIDGKWDFEDHLPLKIMEIYAYIKLISTNEYHALMFLLQNYNSL